MCFFPLALCYLSLIFHSTRCNKHATLSIFWTFASSVRLATWWCVADTVFNMPWIHLSVGPYGCNLFGSHAPNRKWSILKSLLFQEMQQFLIPALGYWEIHISRFPLLFYNFPQSHLQHSAALPGDVQQCEPFVQTLMPDAIIYNFSCDIQAKVRASFCQRNICPIGARAAVLALLLYFGNTSVNWWNDHKFGIRRVHFTTCSIVQKSSGEFITFVCGLLIM